jgi:TonB family protein
VPGRLIKRVDPVYPDIAREDQVDGDVIMTATIAADGTVQNIKVTHGLPQLIRSAVHAVSQWQYEPYRVNGVAVPVATTIGIHFRFSSNQVNTNSSMPQQQAEMVARQAIEKPVLPPTPAGVMRISGRVMEVFVEKKVAPVYPADSIVVDARGTVIVLVTIGKNGEVKDTQVISGPSRFQEAATDAVKQWHWRPYRVEDEAVDVQTTVKLDFVPPR